MNKNKSLLLIFYRNPELGKVKNRLAATIGEERALAIYLLMAAHTRNMALTIPVDRVVYYSEFIDREDNWPNKDFHKQFQQGNNLGEKMKQAFAGSFKSGYKSVCIIGTDCLELSEDILKQAFESLKQHDTVIGPAADGGYYLLGMKKFIPEVFDKKKWSSDSVCRDTLEDFKRLQLSCHLLPTLRDVDNEPDLPIGLR